jgi:hypothetical protein
MIAAAHGIAGFARRLRDDRSAMAFTEFALSLPVLLGLGLTGLEAANLALTHLRVSNIAVLTADSAARVRDTIDEANIADIFEGVRRAGRSLKNFPQNGRVILSSVEPNTAGAGGATTGQYIRWQRCLGVLGTASAYGGEGTGKTNSVLPSITYKGNTIAAQSGTAVMVVEVSYTYQPLVSGKIFGPKTVTYVSAFNVRQRLDQTLYNATKMTAATCDKFLP